MLGLIVATALLGLSPGPAVFATMARAINLGLKQTYIFIAGIVAGDFIFALIAMLGLATLVTQFDLAFVALKVMGGLYLIYLGWKSWKGAGTYHQKLEASSEKGWKIFVSGFLLTASNPKDLLFFVSFLPAFVMLENATWQSVALPAALIALTFTATLSVYALGAAQIRVLLKEPRYALWLNRSAGVMMVLVGVVLLVS